MKTISRLLTYDDHRDSEVDNAISTTTLMGPMFKAKKYLAKEPKNHVIDLVLKRSSFIGTACHSRMEHILKQYPEYILEEYGERQITVNDIVYTISGSCDVLERVGDSEYIIMDMKTGYGAARKSEALEKDAMQMSIYRWIFSDTLGINIDDRAWILWLSQSNNSIDEIAVQLLSLEATEEYIRNKLFAISENDKVDCNEGVRYNTCLYCEYICDNRKGI